MWYVVWCDLRINVSNKIRIFTSIKVKWDCLANCCLWNCCSLPIYSYSINSDIMEWHKHVPCFWHSTLITLPIHPEFKMWTVNIRHNILQEPRSCMKKDWSPNHPRAVRKQNHFTCTVTVIQARVTYVLMFFVPVVKGSCPKQFESFLVLKEWGYWIKIFTDKV